MLLANRTLSKDQQVPLTGEISMKKCVVPFYSELFEQIWLFSAVQALWRDEKRLMGFARLCKNMLGKNHIEYAVRKLFANCRELLLFTYVAKNELFVLTTECPINLNMNFSSLNLKRGSCSSEQLWDNPFWKWELPHSLDKFVSLLEQIWCQIKGTRLVTVHHSFYEIIVIHLHGGMSVIYIWQWPLLSNWTVWKQPFTGIKLDHFSCGPCNSTEKLSSWKSSS